MEARSGHGSPAKYEASESDASRPERVLTRRGKTSVPARNKPSQDPRRVKFAGGKMEKKFVYAGLIVLCALGFSLSYADEAELPSEDKASIEFKIVCAGAGQIGCRKLPKRINQEELYVTTTPFLSTNDIVSAKINEGSGAIDIQFNKEGTRIFNEITSKNAGRRMAIFVDGSLLATPRIYDPVITGKMTITSSLTKEEAKALAGRINKATTKK